MKRYFFGSRNKINSRKNAALVGRVNTYFNGIDGKSDFEQLLKDNVAEGIGIDRTFALGKWLVYEKTGIVMDDEQIYAALHLLDNCVVDMKTGEGKTFSIFLAAAYFALKNEPVHIVTANQYLVERDAAQATEVLGDLGITIGFTQEEMSLDLKIAAYRCDIVYGTVAAFILDYLKDMEITARQDKRISGMAHAIIDEIDSVLIDDARQLYKSPYFDGHYVDHDSYRGIVERFKPIEHFEIDVVNQSLELTDEGFEMMEKWLVDAGLMERADDLYGDAMSYHWRTIKSMLHAKNILREGEHYMIEECKVVLLDKKGRRQPSRCFENGIHQALQASHSLEVTAELAIANTISARVFFGKYRHIAGLSGTALDDYEEYRAIYGLDTVAISPHCASRRIDLPNKVFMNEKLKLNALASDVERHFLSGRPVLIGVLTADKLEEISAIFDERGIPHQKISAKHHSGEAEILEDAGKLGAVTIVTPMAGRGVDIVLGGKRQDSEEWRTAYREVCSLGGLMVIGVERYDVIRVDNQLRGRCGRRGDPGTTQFYLSLEDRLLINFSNNAMGKFFQATPLAKGEPIEMRHLDNAVVKAQNRIKDLYFADRKRIYDYDDVLAIQAKVYGMARDAVIDSGAERLVMMDAMWRDHQVLMLEIQRSVMWRSMAGLDVIVEYKLAAFELFSSFMSRVENILK